MKYRRGKWRIILVKKFPPRAVSDGYTPQTLKLQMLLSVPVLLSFSLITTFPFITVAMVLLFLILSAPLVLTSFRTDRGTLFFIPFFAMWRGVALFAGAICGIAGGISRC